MKTRELTGASRRSSEGKIDGCGKIKVSRSRCPRNQGETAKGVSLFTFKRGTNMRTIMGSIWSGTQPKTAEFVKYGSFKGHLLCRPQNRLSRSFEGGVESS